MTIDEYVTDKEYSDLVSDRDKWRNDAEKLSQIICKLYVWENKSIDEVLKSFK